MSEASYLDEEIKGLDCCWVWAADLFLDGGTLGGFYILDWHQAS